MIGCRAAMAATVALVGLGMVGAAGEARAGGWSSNAAYCHWYWQQARTTHDEYWRDRWRRCLRGDHWDVPRQKPRR